jgi:hypothetical protein
LQLFFDVVEFLKKLFIVTSWETEKTARVSTNSFNLESLGWEMSTFHEDHFIDVARDTWEEFDNDFVFLSRSDFPSHGIYPVKAIQY